MENQVMEEVTAEDIKTLEEQVKDAIKTVFDPEIPVNIYELGLIYQIQILPLGKVHVLMTLTSPNCPAAQSMPGEMEQKIRAVEGVNDFEMELTFDPPWTMEMMSEEAKLELGMM